MNNNDAIALLERAADRADAMLEMAMLAATDARSIARLLKEQEAVEPKKESEDMPERWASWWYVCGNCGREIDWHDKYCRHCGREVKWE